VLTITKLNDAEYVISGVALGVDEYYTGTGEAPGVWHGRLAGELGLEGVVDADDLRALVLGREPGTDVDLLDGRPERKVAAFDLTLSAPKSVSLLWAVGSPEISAAASIAHVEAVTVALDLMERRAGATRQQVDGERQRIPTGLAAATFVHRTSREGDPQLHSHCVVANLGRRPDGTFAALDAAPLYEWGKAAGSVYQEELRRRLTERLGIEWGPDRNGCREIAGFTDEWLRTFSKRTVAIEEHLAGAGPEGSDLATRMRADDAASLATRPAKDGSLTPELLRERWGSEADEVGLPAGHALEAEVTGRLINPSPLPAWDEVADTLVDPDEGLCARRTRFGEAHVVERVAALGAGRFEVGAIEGLARRFLATDDAVLLVDRTGRRSPEYSTALHLDMERAVLGHLDDLGSTGVPGIDQQLVEDAIAREAPGLGPDQATAVRALCAPGPAVRTLISPAGYGKTTTVHAAAAAAGADGYVVLGLAATHQAAGELRNVGIEAITIARFTLDRNRAGLASGTVIVLDESSQVATADAEIVLAAVACTPGARLWCLGDPQQAQSVRAGGLATELARLAAAGTVPAAALTENRRQLEAAERKALAHYRAGHIAVSQAIRTSHGWEHDLGSPHATREGLADQAAADIATHGSQAVVALAVSHADCEDLADRIRTRLKDAGIITGPELIGPAWARGERHYAAGDQVLVHGRVQTGGHRLHNGSVVTVGAVTDAGLDVIDHRGQPCFLPREFVEGHRSDRSPNLSHAWARTVDGVQAGTWTQVHLLGTAALERFTGYVGQSRSRCATHTWNVARVAHVDHGGVLAEQRTPDREVLDAMLRVSDSGFAVHDVPDRLAELLAERAEHQRVLTTRPPERLRHVLAAQRELDHARKERDDAAWRLDNARHELDQLSRFSQLRSRGRYDKATLVERISRFGGDIQKAEDNITNSEHNLDRVQREFADEIQWDARHGWRTERLDAIEAELAEMRGEPDVRGHGIAASERPAALLARRENSPTGSWEPRVTEIAAPRPPEVGHGIDIGW
jgi:conjugative relaxase-like TrwC/TraI family protein